MDLQEKMMKEIFETYFRNVLSELLPNALNEAIASSDILKRQEFISLSRAIKRYNLSRRTLYNYHQREYITLYSSQGKTFVSVTELENHIKNNPLARHDNVNANLKSK